MLVPDILLSISLIVFVMAWFRRSLSRRELLLRTVLIIAILAAIWGLAIDRWQTGFGGLGAVILMLIVLFRRKPKNAQTGVPYVSGSLFALGAAAAITIIYMFPIQHLPQPSGPNAVGVSTFELRDVSRPGIFLAKPDEPRRLLLRAWYPANPETGSKPEKYFNDLEARSTARGFGELLGFPPLLTYIRHVKTHSYENAPPVKTGSRFKSVVFSHGYGSFPQQNTALMEHLASHGYVVFSIQHTYDSSAAAFPNGDVAPMDPSFVSDNLGETPQRFSYSEAAGDRWAARLKMQQNYEDEGLRFTQSSAPVWLDDQRFVVDQLQSGTVPENVAELVKRSELDRVAVIGMSFGGSTAGAFCLQDERCVAGINMDGLDIHFRATNQRMNVPFLMLHTDLNGFGRMIGAPKDTRLFGFNEFAYTRFEDAGTVSDIVRLEVKGVLHLGFSDFTLFMRRPLRDLLLGSGSADRIINIQNDVVLDFLDQSFNGSESQFPRAILDKHAGHVVELDNSAVRAWWAELSSEQKDNIRTEIEALSVN